MPTGRPKGTKDKRRRVVPAASLANLRAPWKRGQSGNPHGRPLLTLSGQAVALLTPPRRLKILKAILKKAEAGDSQACLCLARLEKHFQREIAEASRGRRHALPGDFAPGSQRLLASPPADMSEIYSAAAKAAADSAAEPAEQTETNEGESE